MSNAFETITLFSTPVVISELPDAAALNSDLRVVIGQREAVSALRRITQAPIKYVILTHGHWDHVGGLAAVR